MVEAQKKFNKLIEIPKQNTTQQNYQNIQKQVNFQHNYNILQENENLLKFIVKDEIYQDKANIFNDGEQYPDTLEIISTNEQDFFEQITEIQKYSNQQNLAIQHITISCIKCKLKNDYKCEILKNYSNLITAQIILSNNSITDFQTIAESMKNLQFLQQIELDLSFNKITELNYLPNFNYIVSLTDLNIDMQSNKIKEIQYMSLSFFQLQHLQILILNFNSNSFKSIQSLGFSEWLPQSLQNLTFYLWKSNISDITPLTQAFSKLYNLQILKVQVHNCQEQVQFNQGQYIEFYPYQFLKKECDVLLCQPKKTTQNNNNSYDFESGVYFEQNRDNQNKNCQTCINSAFQCTQCLEQQTDGELLFRYDLQCLTSSQCQSLQGNVPHIPDPQNYVCEGCQVENCFQCVQDNYYTCFKCNQDLYLNKNTCQESCDTGYYPIQQNNNNICEPCKIEGCAVCSPQSPQTCQQCQKILNKTIQLYLYTSEDPTDQYQKCLLKCPSHTYANDQNICTACEVEYCDTCSSQLGCDSCQSPYFLLTIDIISSCETDCPIGYRKNSDKQECQLCKQNESLFSLSPSLHCNTCPEDYKLCTQCSSKFVNQDGNCQMSCKTGYIVVHDGEDHSKEDNYQEVCKKCDDNCHECWNTVSNCFSCKNKGDKYLYKGKCLPACPYYTYSFYSSCTECQQSKNCLTCQQSKCITCYSDGEKNREDVIAPYLYNGACLSQCTPGTFAIKNPNYDGENQYVVSGQIKILESNMICQVCDPNCRLCSDTPTLCTACQSDQYLDTELQQCKSCCSTCLTCAGQSETDCKKCISTLIKMNNVCQESCDSGYEPDEENLECIEKKPEPKKNSKLFYIILIASITVICCIIAIIFAFLWHKKKKKNQLKKLEYQNNQKDGVYKKLLNQNSDLKDQSMLSGNKLELINTNGEQQDDFLSVLKQQIIGINNNSQTNFSSDENNQNLLQLHKEYQQLQIGGEKNSNNRNNYVKISNNDHQQVSQSTLDILALQQQQKLQSQSQDSDTNISQKMIEIRQQNDNITNTENNINNQPEKFNFQKKIQSASSLSKQNQPHNQQPLPKNNQYIYQNQYQYQQQQQVDTIQVSDHHLNDLKESQWSLNEPKEISVQEFNSRYKKLENLGEGSFGVVDKYLSVRSKRVVAIKLFKFAKNKYLINQGLREANALMTANQFCDNVVKLEKAFFVVEHTPTVSDLQCQIYQNQQNQNKEIYNNMLIQLQQHRLAYPSNEKGQLGESSEIEIEQQKHRLFQQQQLQQLQLNQNQNQILGESSEIESSQQNNNNIVQQQQQIQLNSPIKNLIMSKLPESQYTITEIENDHSFDLKKSQEEKTRNEEKKIMLQDLDLKLQIEQDLKNNSCTINNTINSVDNSNQINNNNQQQQLGCSDEQEQQQQQYYQNKSQNLIQDDEQNTINTINNNRNINNNIQTYNSSIYEQVEENTINDVKSNSQQSQQQQQQNSKNNKDINNNSSSNHNSQEIDPQRNRQLALVMELADKSLSDLFSEYRAEGKLFEQYQIVNLISQMSNTLSVFHNTLKIAHRDIKPQNILIVGDKFKICDLGVSKCIESTMKVTFNHTITGTLNYISPEEKKNYILALQHQQNDQLAYNAFLSDIYSMGLVFFEAVTLSKIQGLNDDPQKLQKSINSSLFKRKDINPEILKTIQKMLRWNPEERITAENLKKSYC